LNVTASDQRRRRALAHYEELARIGKVLASPVRLRLLDLLRQGSRNVDELAEAAGATVANSSRHLQQMRSARLVRAEREGKNVRYRIADESVSAAYGLLRGLAESVLPEMDLLRRELGALEAGEREELLGRIARSEVTLVDTRPVEEFRAGHLPGARSMPLEELPGRVHEIPREREVVAYCRGPYCPMATRAVEILRAAGYRARHLDLGIPDLRARAVAITSGEGAERVKRPAGRRSRPPPRKPRKIR
jgi:DNA-binding transcriptional ArsR family regulator/rhodanese-related sulfurtransferase